MKRKDSSKEQVPQIITYRTVNVLNYIPPPQRIQFNTPLSISLLTELILDSTHRLMSRSSSCSACSSSDSSSPLADEEEEELSDCLGLPVS